MQLALIRQILAENDSIQQLSVNQRPALLMAGYRRIKKLVRQLQHTDPYQKSYCLAFTFLTDGHELTFQQIETLHQREFNVPAFNSTYRLAFERLQYQIHLAASVLT